MKVNQYVRDKRGNVYHIEGNPFNKLRDVKKSLDYWKKFLEDNPKEKRAIRFLENLEYLFNQIKLLISSIKESETDNKWGGHKRNIAYLSGAGNPFYK